MFEFLRYKYGVEILYNGNRGSHISFHIDVRYLIDYEIWMVDFPEGRCIDLAMGIFSLIIEHRS